LAGETALDWFSVALCLAVVFFLAAGISKGPFYIIMKFLAGGSRQ
jgi:hypothetical protein